MCYNVKNQLNFSKLGLTKLSLLYCRTSSLYIIYILTDIDNIHIDLNYLISLLVLHQVLNIEFQNTIHNNRLCNFKLLQEQNYCLSH